MCARRPAALVVDHRARSKDRHRRRRGLRVRCRPHDRVLRGAPCRCSSHASAPSPAYLSLKLDLDPHKIAELVLKVYPNGLPPVQERSAVYICPADENIVNAATRLVECLARPGDAELVAPLVIDEILIRLLRSPIGVRVAQMGFAESSVHRVAKA